MATIGAHYFRACTRGAERLGHDRERLLAAAGHTPAEVAQPGWRGSVESMALLVRAIWSTLDDEHMGCTGHAVRSGALVTMVEFAMGADTVLEALERGIRFYRLLTDQLETRLEAQGDDVAVTVTLRRPDLDPDHYFTEFWMITWHRLASWLAGETIAISLAEFTYLRPDAYFEEFKYLFPCTHRFEQSACRLHFERAPLLRPIARTEADRRDMALRAPLDFMTIPSSDRSLARKVRRLLSSPASAPFGPLRLAEIATELQMHPVALARGLRREGTSVTQITENLRRDLAMSRLERGNATVESISAELGFVEPRSFTRAFRQWTGVSPLRFRRNRQAGATEALE